jgi:hypothetical protein
LTQCGSSRVVRSIREWNTRTPCDLLQYTGLPSPVPPWSQLEAPFSLTLGVWEMVNVYATQAKKGVRAMGIFNEGLLDHHNPEADTEYEAESPVASIGFGGVLGNKTSQ